MYENATGWATPAEVLTRPVVIGDASHTYETGLTMGKPAHGADDRLRFGSCNLVVVGSSGTGKDTCISVPAARSWRDTLVVLEAGGHVARDAESARTAMGQRIIRFYPDLALENHDRFNPFDQIAWEQERATTDLWHAVESFIGQVRRHSQYDHRAILIISGAAAYLKWAGLTLNFNALAQFFGDGMGRYTSALAHLRRNTDYDATQAAHLRLLALSNLLAIDEFPENERVGTIAHAYTALAPYLNPALARATAASTFRLDDLSEPTTLFAGFNSDAGHVAGVLRCFVDMIAQRALYRNGTASSSPILLVIPDVGFVGALNCIEQSYGAMRKHPFATILCAQSAAQIEGIYSRQADILDRADAVICTGTHDAKTAEWLSRRCGMIEAEREVVAERRKRGVFTQTVTRKERYKTPLIHPRDVIEPRDEAILVATGMRPAMVTKAAHWSWGRAV